MWKQITHPKKQPIIHAFVTGRKFQFSGSFFTFFSGLLTCAPDELYKTRYNIKLLSLESTTEYSFLFWWKSSVFIQEIVYFMSRREIVVKHDIYLICVLGMEKVVVSSVVGKPIKNIFSREHYSVLLIYKRKCRHSTSSNPVLYQFTLFRYNFSAK